MLLADTVEDGPPWMASMSDSSRVLRQVGKGHAVVGQHGVDRVGEGRHDAAEEVRSVDLACVVAEREVGELGTRSIARNMTGLPCAKRGSLMSMCTYPIVASVTRPRLKA